MPGFFSPDKIPPVAASTFKKILKKSPAQVFSCEFYKIFKNPFFPEHHRTNAAGFFCSCYCFLPPGELIETSFFYFWTSFITAFERDEHHAFKRSTCCCMGAHISW